ncbi:hypothetical protein [Kiloniella majae]|uniref:hypothetical protein n=1 Tax=Kiloniella majae TaxID=1938558 RepID=UPI0015C4F3DF|nr:hypothetical protein [Kiloniella majae]
MTLEEIYWGAGIVGAVVTVIGFVFSVKLKKNNEIRQNLKISGDSNQIKQSIKTVHKDK